MGECEIGFWFLDAEASEHEVYLGYCGSPDSVDMFTKFQFVVKVSPGKPGAFYVLDRDSVYAILGRRSFVAKPDPDTVFRGKNKVEGIAPGNESFDGHLRQHD